MSAPRDTHPLDLPALGWDDSYAAEFTPYAAEHLPARVSRVDRGACDALSGDGPLRLTFSGALLSAGAADPVATPCVGDWVAARTWPDGRVTAEAVLPRRTAFVRASVTPGSSHGQVLAANVDLAVVVEPLHPEPDLGRIERFLALAWESGATPMVVLTKADLVPDAAELRADVAAAAPGVEVVAISNTTGDGLDEVRTHVVAGRTLALLGPSGAGKSTLTNALVGQKVAITSAKPQTTRHTIRGVVHRPDAQLVLVDTPGLHRPRTLLGERLNDLVRSTWSEVDVIGLCLPADEEIGRGDRFIAAEIAELKATVIAVVTKTDLVARGTLAERLLAVQNLGDFAEIVPVSAVTGDQVELLTDVMIKYLPPSPQLYPEGMLTDEQEHVLMAELIREATLEGVRDELPHSIAVLVEEVLPEEGLTKIYADIYVERPSQKAIVICAGGSRMKEVGTRARRQIEELIGGRVFLDLHVRVAKDWQRDPKQLRRLGF